MGKTKKITITVSNDMYDKLQEMSDAMGITKNSLCTAYVGQQIYALQVGEAMVQKMVADCIAEYEEKNKK